MDSCKLKTTILSPTPEILVESHKKTQHPRFSGFDCNPSLLIQPCVSTLFHLCLSREREPAGCLQHGLVLGQRLASASALFLYSGCLRGTRPLWAPSSPCAPATFWLRCGDPSLSLVVDRALGASEAQLGFCRWMA